MVDTTEARYEFRVWGHDLDEAARRIRSMGPPLAVHTRTETYFVSPAADGVNGKARGGELDVKVLRSVADGFEQWEVHLKAEFPVAASVVQGELLPLLGVDGVRLDAAQYSLEELVKRVVEPQGAELRAVEVRKHRHQHRIGECVAEFTSVTIDDRDTYTVAVESTELDALRAVRRDLGLEGRRNLSYPQALRGAVSDRTHDADTTERD